MTRMPRRSAPCVKLIVITLTLAVSVDSTVDISGCCCTYQIENIPTYSYLFHCSSASSEAVTSVYSDASNPESNCVGNIEHNYTDGICSANNPSISLPGVTYWDLVTDEDTCASFADSYVSYTVTCTLQQGGNRPMSAGAAAALAFVAIAIVVGLVWVVIYLVNRRRPFLPPSARKMFCAPTSGGQDSDMTLL